RLPLLVLRVECEVTLIHPPVDARRCFSALTCTERFEQQLLEFRGICPAEFVAELVTQAGAERRMPLPGREGNETRLMDSSHRGRIQTRVAIRQDQPCHPADHELLRFGDN